MPWTVPDQGVAPMDIVAHPYAASYDAVAAALAGTECVLSGCAVAPSTALTLSVSAGAVLSQGVLLPVAASAVVVSVADINFFRVDIVVVTSAGTLAVRAGTAGPIPRPPPRQAGDVLLALVFVPGAAAALAASQIADMRMQRIQGPLCIGRRSTELIVANTLLATQLYSLTLPAGLLDTGRQLNLRLGGNYLSNSGTPTFRFTIRLGGIGYWTDVTAATAADVDRGAWDMDINITARAAATQRITGHLRMQTPGAKAAPTTGVGDVGVVTHISAPIWAAASAAMDAANTAVSIEVTMSVANANVQTVVEQVNAVLV